MLPQQVLAKRLLHKDYLRRLEEVDKQAQAALAQNRATQRGDFQRSGITKADLEVYEQAKREFESIYQRSFATHERVNIERSVVGKEDGWITQLPAGTLEVVEPVQPTNGIDLAMVRSKIASLRVEKARINSAPAPANRARIGAWIDQRRRAAEAEIEQLVGRYPHFVNDALDHGTMLALLTTLVSRDVVVDVLASRIDGKAEAAIPVSERAGALKRIETEITEWLRLDSALTDKAISDGAVDVAHDKESAPWITLGVAMVPDAVANNGMTALAS